MDPINQPIDPFHPQSIVEVLTAVNAAEAALIQRLNDISSRLQRRRPHIDPKSWQQILQQIGLLRDASVQMSSDTVNTINALNRQSGP